MTARRFRRAVLAAACVAALGGSGLAAPAGAGEFTVRQCDGSSYQGFFGDYIRIGADHVDVVDGCRPGQATKIGVYQDRSGSPFSNGDGGQFLWNVPQGIEVFGTVFTSRLNDINGIRAELIGISNYLPPVALDEGRPHDGAQRTTRWTNRSAPRNLIAARLTCANAGGCANAAGGTKAYFEVTDAEFRSRDVAGPVVGGSGFLWLWGNDWKWHRGIVGFRIDAIDQGAGVASEFLLVNGLRVDLDAIGCPGDQSTYATRFDPCPAFATRSGAANTSLAPFQEGANSVQFCAEDYAASADDANRTCTASRVVFIDNVAPAAPIDLHPSGGTDWRPRNGFDVVWNNPEGQRAEIVEADWRLVRIAGNAVADSGTTALGPDPGLPRLEMPEPGEYRVEVQLRDAAGNLGAASTTTLRFDDKQPGDVAPEAPPGWISADELPFDQEIERAAAGGPSGVGGYAFTISRSGPIAPCPTGVCGPLELSMNDGVDDRTARISDLAEGSHWVAAVAASGARVSSQTAGATVLRVDKTDPVTRLEGVPNRWVNQPVTVTAIAGDTGSGMSRKPGDDGDPVTAIQAGDSAPYVSPGGSAVFTIADEGVTPVRYWARDLAGNANYGQPAGPGETQAEPGTATVRIDRRPPVIKFHEERDQHDPEVIRAAVRDGDSGLDFGTISYRPAGGSGGFRELNTVIGADGLTARLPSDDLVDARYLIRARAVDRAGNVADTAVTGTGLNLDLPLKQPVRLTASFRKGKRLVRRMGVAHGKRARLSGRLTRAGSGLAGVRLTVEEGFATGSRRRSRVSRARTDGTGRFVISVAPGPSRVIRIHYGGSRVNRRTASRRLSLTVRDRTRFRIRPAVLRNRGRVRMSGLVAGRGALRPARGKLVAIQYFDPSRSKWRPVEVLRANRRGHFRYSYRFRTIDFAQRILFRAVSLPEAGWPFAPSVSRPRSVIVYPAKGSGRTGGRQ